MLQGIRVGRFRVSRFLGSGLWGVPMVFSAKHISQLLNSLDQKVHVVYEEMITAYPETMYGVASINCPTVDSNRSNKIEARTPPSTLYRGYMDPNNAYLDLNTGKVGGAARNRIPGSTPQTLDLEPC